jgi:hypothetical protein
MRVLSFSVLLFDSSYLHTGALTHHHMILFLV